MYIGKNIGLGVICSYLLTIWKRLEGYWNAYNFVSLAALWPAVIGNENVLDMFDNENQHVLIDQDLIFNTDCTSVLIG